MAAARPSEMLITSVGDILYLVPDSPSVPFRNKNTKERSQHHSYKSRETVVFIHTTNHGTPP